MVADASCDVAETHRSTVLLGGVVVRCGEYDIPGTGVVFLRSGARRMYEQWYRSLPSFAADFCLVCYVQTVLMMSPNKV